MRSRRQLLLYDKLTESLAKLNGTASFTHSGTFASVQGLAVILQDFAGYHLVFEEVLDVDKPHRDL